jgi:hypothetical protein
MKLTCLAIAILATAPLTRAQDAPPKPPPSPQARQQSASDDEAAKADRDRSQAIKQADEAVRQAGQNRQLNAIRSDGKGRYVALQPVKMQKAAWLGLTASPPPAALRHQLKLADGTALVVDFVQPKSPADMAGIKQYDLLIKLNEQVLINPEQLAVLVRTFKSGDTIHLNYFREGDRHTQDITLVERELPPLDEMQMQFFPGDMNLRPIPGNPQGRVSPFGGAQGTNPPSIGPDGQTIERSEHSLTWSDGRRQIIVNLADDRKTITMTDNRTGKVIYKGPIDEAADQKSLPREARDAVDRVRAFLKSSSNSNDKSISNNDENSKKPEGF